MEENLRRALTLSDGDWGVLVERPMSASLLGVCLLLLGFICLPFIRRRREQVFTESDA